MANSVTRRTVLRGAVAATATGALAAPFVHRAYAAGSLSVGFWDHWVPCAARIDMFKDIVGVDLQKMYPADAPEDKELAAKWTWDFFLQAAEKLDKAGHKMGVGFGVTNDSVAWTDPVIRSMGAAMVDKD